ncbi:MAG TPA: type IV secretion protein DotN [Rhodospirillaceae bacterium]|nr:type IV secretion protein DotN [Rhodospirillaceae bacterium]
MSFSPPFFLTLMGGGGFHPSPADPVFQATRTRILERDGHACRYCGFTAKKYQEIQFLNGNTRDMSDDNLATACVFCHQCLNLERAGQMNSGILIYAPEIDQVTLHHLTRSIYVARRTQGPMADSARIAMNALLSRKDEAAARLGSDSPRLLAAVMRELLEPGTYKRRMQVLDGIRLMPLDKRLLKEDDFEFDQFPQILAYWRSTNGPYGKTLPPTWPAMLQSVMEKAA